MPRTLDDAARDVRHAVRTLSRSPAFFLLASGTLAIGIGAAVAIFTVVNAVLLRPLPLRDPVRLLSVNAQERASHSTVGASVPRYRALAGQSRTLSGVAAFVTRQLTVSDGRGRVVPGARVTRAFFDVLGVAPAAGRTFLPIEDTDTGTPVAVISAAFRQRYLAGSADPIGQALRIEGRSTTIIGALPADFRFSFSSQEPQIFLANVAMPGVMTAAQIRNGAGYLEYVARMKMEYAGQARQELAAVDERYRATFASNTDASRYVLAAVPLTENLVGDVRPALFILMSAVLLVLAIACANVSHLLLARAASRQREIAARLALGASRLRLVRQFLAESLVLSLTGCAVGAALAAGAVRLLAAHGPASIPRLSEAAPDARVLLFAIAMAVLTALCFGIAPALRVSGVDVNSALRGGRSGGLTGRPARRLHNLLAVSEMAVTAALLIAAALLFQSLARLQRVDAGFRPDSVQTAAIALPRARYADPEQREQFFTRVLGDLRGAPGVSAAAATSYLPMAGANSRIFLPSRRRAPLGPGRH